MKTVWKFPLSHRSVNTVALPLGTIFLHVGIDPDEGGVAFWAQVERGAPCVDRRFVIYGTGRDVYPHDVHIGTVIDRGYVWLVYERP